MIKDAIISEDEKYRYMLSRIWDKNKPTVTIIGLNPSTADANNDDPTLKRCIEFARSWDYGGIYMLNLFAYRATQPSDMKKVNDPIGQENDMFIKAYTKRSDKVICAWGNDGCFLNRASNVINSIPNKYYLKLNKSGEPAHPLYLSSKLTPLEYPSK